MSEAGKNEAAASSPIGKPTAVEGLHYVNYGDQKESPYLTAIRQLISQDLSEPYSIYVYRYFLYQWGNLCFMVSPQTAESVSV